jgi:hypothetical protein
MRSINAFAPTPRSQDRLVVNAALELDQVWDRNLGIYVRVIIHMRHTEAKQTKEVALIPLKVGQCMEVFRADPRPEFLNLPLHVLIELLFVRTQSTFLIELWRVAVQALLIQAVDLFDAPFMSTSAFHNLEQ